MCLRLNFQMLDHRANSHAIVDGIDMWGTIIFNSRYDQRELWETREDFQFERELGDGMRWNFLIVVPSLYIPRIYYALVYTWKYIYMYKCHEPKKIQNIFVKYICEENIKISFPSLFHEKYKLLSINDK